MSSDNVYRSKDVALKSRIPVPVSKNNIDNLREKKLPISSKSFLPKCANMLQKAPTQLRSLPNKIESSHNRGSLLAISEQNRILKQINPDVKSDVCTKKINNLQIKSGMYKKEKPSKVISRINTKENNNAWHKNSDPNKNNKKQLVTKHLKDSKKAIQKVTAKKIGDTLNKNTEPQKNGIVQKSTSEANEKEKAATKPNYFCSQKNGIVQKSTSEANKKEKAATKPNYISSQKDIKFEANDFFRNMILSNKELSPSILKLQPGLKLSSMYAERPSAYQKFEIPANPFQEALKSIERGMSSVKKDRKLSIIKQSTLPASPFKERNSFYTPHRDPRNEVMKSLEAIKTKQFLKKTLKSAKKVSFNLNVEEYAPEASLDYKPTPFKNSECRLTKINEKSEENTPTSPQNNINETSTKLKNDVLTTPELVASVKELCLSSETKAVSENVQNSQYVKKYCSDTSENLKFNTPMTKSVAISRDIQSNAVVAQCENLTKEITSNTKFHSLRKIHLNYLSPTSNCDNSRVLCVTSLKGIRRMSFQNSVNVLDVKGSEARLYTPRPISMTTSSFVDAVSPEFLTNGTKGKFMSNFAPIRTPLVLKNLADCLLSPEADLSPVRLKLDFTEDKDSPKKEALTKNLNLLTFENIMTTQKLLDELADQECCLWLVNENIPVVCGRYLQNPVALTLSEGDEMHFIPI